MGMHAVIVSMIRHPVLQTAVVLARLKPVPVVNGERLPVAQITIPALVQPNAVIVKMVRHPVLQTAVVLANSKHVKMVPGVQLRHVTVTILARVLRHADPVWTERNRVQPAVTMLVK